MARSNTKAERQQDTKTQRDNKQDEADRYRRAAEDALQQLDWTIGYLHGIHKVEISKALAKNRSFIRQQPMHEPDEALPAQQTGEK